MFTDCLICNAPIKYTEAEEEMTCMLCGKKEGSNSCYEQGHYVCDECHIAGMDQFFVLCMNTTSKNPMDVFSELTELPFCHMHGPEHHTLVGAALVTAYKNAGGNIDLQNALKEVYARGRKVPGGICGFWGACGAAISSGQFVSIVTKTTPLSSNTWGMANLMTSQSLRSIGEVGGPRCCKRNSRLAIIEAVKFTAENLDVHMELPKSCTCDHCADNALCIGQRCPFI